MHHFNTAHPLSWFKIGQLARRNVLRQKRRSVTTALITALGGMGLLIFGGFAQFTFDSLAESSARDSGHLIAADPRFFNESEEIPMEFGLSDATQTIQQIEQFDAVRMALPSIHLSGLISNGDKSTVFVGRGLHTDEFYVKGPFLTIIDGQILSPNQADFAAATQLEVLLGQELAKEMKAKVGDDLTLMSTTVDGTLNALDVTVVGIVSTGVPDVDKRLVLTHLSLAQGLLMTDKVSQIMVFLNHMNQTPAMQQQLSRELNSLQWKSWEALAFFYHKVKSLYQGIFGMIGAVVLLLVFFSVINTMTMTILERTQEIGTLRALGTTRGELKRLFALEGAMIGLAGALGGIVLNVLAFLFLKVADIQMPPPPGRSEGYPLWISLEPDQMLWTVGLLTLISCLAALWSARHAINQSIVQALATH